MSTSLQKLAWFKSVFRALFSYFDDTKCRWETEKDSCDDYVTDSNVIFTGETNSDTDSVTDSVTDSDNDSDNNSDTDSDTESDTDFPHNDTNVVDEISNDDVTHATTDGDTPVMDTDVDTEMDPTEVTTEKPFYQNLECEPLDESWMCSSGSKNHSLCIKFCTIGSGLSNSPLR